MEIGLLVAFASPACDAEFVRRVAQRIDENGFATLWAPEHVLLFDEYASRYPYDESGKFPVSGESGLLDNFIALTFAAAVTKRIRVGTGITLVPQRNPVYTAKMASDLDVLSGGRLDFGVGVGWLREEFEALSMRFEGRGAICRDFLAVIRSLWCDPVSEYDGKHYRLPSCRQYPKPVQQPHPPIWFGGESDPALRRVADLGRGWFGFALLPEEAEERIAKLESLLGERGRSRKDVRIALSPYTKPYDFDTIRRYADLGVDQVVLTVMAPSLDETLQQIDELAEKYAEPARWL